MTAHAGAALSPAGAGTREVALLMSAEEALLDDAAAIPLLTGAEAALDVAAISLPTGAEAALDVAVISLPSGAEAALLDVAVCDLTSPPDTR